MMRTAMVAGCIGSAELADLVARGAALGLTVPALSLERLAALGPSTSAVDQTTLGDLRASCTFQQGSEGYPQLHLVVTGTVPLVCQRCLGLLEFPVSLDVLLTVIRSDAEAAGLAAPFETALLVDEVLAALPLSPRHSETAACGRIEQANFGEVNRPLAGLADLLGRRDQQGNK
jgi:uncharacterized protein